ncbi:hypothetical protein L1D19_05840 [Vibrio natriegens]|uniref:hypothetical protein n=1 Tax=Vibrio natriegens TaxID=691 RepID=UPI001EFEEA65|nr:hypothetical protein [Vibrio natriegens]MCG9699653.1 hypothetical protein [Vibrio natriegens]
MPKNVMLSIDLEDADNVQRDCFYTSLKRDGWIKSSYVETTWFKNYSDTPHLSIKDNVTDNLQRASEIGEVVFRACFLIGIDNAQVEQLTGGKPRLKGW